MGYTDIRVKADNGNPIAAVMERITGFRDPRNVGKTIPDQCIEGQFQSNGAAEKAVQDVTTQVRKYKIALETKLGRLIRARSVIFKWIVEHAADTINRHTSGHDGKVPLQRSNHRLPKPVGIEFGEQVWAKVPTYVNKRTRS